MDITGNFYENMTKMEIEVLKRMSKYKDYNKIALDMNLSSYVVKMNIKNILKKFNVDENSQAVTKAIKYNLIDR